MKNGYTNVVHRSHTPNAVGKRMMRLAEKDSGFPKFIDRRLTMSNIAKYFCWRSIIALGCGKQYKPYDCEPSGFIE
jgi:hypothetical protein